MTSYALAPGYGSLEDYRRAEEEQRWAHWARWSAVGEKQLSALVKDENMTLEKSMR